MALKMTKKKPAQVTETKEVKDKGTVLSEDTKTETHEDPALMDQVQNTPAAPLCEVGVDMSYTHNLGNYQSCRFGVSLKVPCSTDEINEVYDYGKSWCEERINALVEELEQAE